MALRNRGGRWHYRFQYNGKEYAETTGLAATKRNKSKALVLEMEHRQALMEGRSPQRRIVVREFSDAAKEFLCWADMNYREHPSSAKRIKTSFASATEFFGRTVVSMIDASQIERYKSHRITQHKVRDITLRHDLHALSKFFGYAMKQRWTTSNPIREVSIPSDADAVRIHVVSAKEEQEYFARAAQFKDLHDVGRLILNQGCRPEEITSLRKEDVDMERGQMKIRAGKTSAARRTLDLTTESKLILGRRMAGESKWLFPSKRNPGKPISRVNSQHDKTGAKFVLYDLRHTFGTRMAQEGVDLPSLAAILGHNSLRVVQKYVHPTAEHKKAAMLKYEQSQVKEVSQWTN